jgi:NADH-quinone oxidoreductase subunit M
MSSIGLPGLNGFVGEFLILVGAFVASPWVGATATVGVVLAAAYLLWAYRRVFFGPVEEPENRSLIDLSFREMFVVLALLVPIVWIGVAPSPFLRRLDASVGELLHQMEQKKAAARDLGPHDVIAEVMIRAEALR